MTDYNPHDLLQQAGTSYIIGVVIDIQDPDNAGRCKVVLALQEPARGQEPIHLGWCPSINPNPSTRQVGWSGSNYVPGDKVYLVSTGSQTFSIVGSVPNVQKPKQYADVASEARVASKQKHLTGTGDNVLQITAGRILAGITNVRDAMKIVNSVTPTDYNPHIGDPYNSIQAHLKTPAYMGGQVGTIMRKLAMPHTIGTYKHFKGNNSLKNATKFAQQLLGQKGELIPNSFKMIETLKKVGKRGLNIPSVPSIGGSNIVGFALMGIARLIAAASPSTKTKEQEDEIDLIEELLRILYKEMTGQDALDKDKKETKQYQMWKAEFVKGLLSGNTTS